MNDRHRADSDQRSSWFESLIRSYYPGLARIEHVPPNTSLQLHGCDLRLFMQNGLCDSWDCKFREKNRDDICIEHTHKYTDGKQTLGWVEKNLWCRRIAYCFKPTRRLLLIPWPELRQAWFQNREQWKRDFFSAPSGKNNSGYVTISTCVPIDVLKTLMRIEVMQ